jgi:hypothetical protein
LGKNKSIGEPSGAACVPASKPRLACSKARIVSSQPPGSHLFLADLLNLLHIKAFKMILPFFLVEIVEFQVYDLWKSLTLRSLIVQERYFGYF